MHDRSAPLHRPDQRCPTGAGQPLRPLPQGVPRRPVRGAADARHRHRLPRLRRPLAGSVRGWPPGRASSCSRATMRRCRSLPDDALSADEAIDRGIVLEALDGLRFEATSLRDEACDPLTYVLVLGSGLHGLLAREFAPWRHRGSAFLWRARRVPEVLEAARATLTGLPGRPGRACSRPRPRSSSCPASCRWSTRPSRRRAARTVRMRRPSSRASRRCATTSRRRSTPSAGISRPSCGRRRPGRADSVPTCSPPSCATRCRAICRSRRSGLARSTTSTPSGRSSCGSRRSSGPGLHPGATMPADEDEVVRQTWLAVAARHPGARRPARLLSTRDGRHRGLRARDRARRAARCAAAHHLDAGVPAAVRRRLPVAARAARSRPGQRVLGHAAGPDVAGRASRVVPARRERPDAPDPLHPRGDPGPLPAAGLVESDAVAGARRLPERHVRRGLGRLRDPGHDGRGLWRRRSGAPAGPLEVLPALHHEHAPRHRHPRRRHGRGGGHGPDGRGRLPGGAGGTRQVPPRSTLVDPAVDLLRRVAGDVGPRAGRPSQGRRGRRRRRRCGPRARPRRRLPRDAGLRSARPPRGGHLARLPAHPLGAARSCSATWASVRPGARDDAPPQDER